MGGASALAPNEDMAGVEASQSAEARTPGSDEPSVVSQATAGDAKPHGAEPSRLRRRATAAWNLVLDQWFILGLGLAIGIAAAVPNLGKTGGWIQSQWSVKIPATVIIFLLSGMSLKTRVLMGAAGQMHLHLLIQGISLAIIPLIGYGISKGLWDTGINPTLVSGFVILASMPTTVSTNVVFTAKAGGNEAAALINAVLGKLIGIFITPAWMSAFLSVQGQAPYSKVLTEMAYTVIAPLLVGQGLQYGAPKAVAWLQNHVNFGDVSQAMILLLVWTTFSNTFAAEGDQASVGDVFAVIGLDFMLLIMSIGLCFGLALALGASLDQCGGRCTGALHSAASPGHDVEAAPAHPSLSPAADADAAADVDDAGGNDHCAKAGSGSSAIAVACSGLQHPQVTRADTVAVVIVGSTKTLALGVPLISVAYGSSPQIGLLTAPLIGYHAIQIVTLGAALRWMRLWAEAGGAPWALRTGMHG